MEAECLRIFVVHASGTDDDHCAEGHVPEVQTDSRLAECVVLTLVRELLLDFRRLANQRLDTVGVKEEDQGDGHEAVCEDEDRKNNCALAFGHSTSNREVKQDRNVGPKNGQVQIVRLFVDDSFGEGLSLAEETASVLLVVDDEGIKYCEDEGENAQGHREGGEGGVCEETALDADNETVGAKVIRDKAS